MSKETKSVESIVIFADPEQGIVEIEFKYAVRGLKMDAAAARSLANTLLDAARQAEKKPPVQ